MNFSKNKFSENDKKLAIERLRLILEKKCCICLHNKEEKIEYINLIVVNSANHLICNNCYQKKIIVNKNNNTKNKKVEIKYENKSEEKEIEKNKKANEILLNNQNELNLIKYEGEDILFQSPPLKFQNKNNEIEYYSGTFDNKGNFCGIGTLITKDKNIYNGSFKNGLFDGKGIFVNENGNYYFGDWKNGKIEGKGRNNSKSSKRYKK